MLAWPARPQEDRAALARAFIAKAVFAITTTRALIERLAIDPSLRRLCGWSRAGEVPGEATFSRAFSTFADSALPSRLHEALIDKTRRDHLVGHVSRDSTAIEGREKPAPQSKPSATPKRRRGRPRKGAQRPKASRRLERQLRMTLKEMPTTCHAPPMSVSSKAPRDIGNHGAASLHIDAADGGIPLSCILTSASLHDSQAAIPLATMTGTRVTHLYDLMDSAYDAPEIRAHSASLGHVAIIGVNPRSAARKRELAAEAKAQRSLGHVSCEQVRYRERSTVERVNVGASKLQPQGRLWRSSGTRARSRQVLCHLMFGILALTVAQFGTDWPETDLIPSSLQALHSRAEDARERFDHSQTKRLHRRQLVTEVKHHRRLDGVSEPKTANCQSP